MNSTLISLFNKQLPIGKRVILLDWTGHSYHDKITSKAWEYNGEIVVQLEKYGVRNVSDIKEFKLLSANILFE